MFLIKAKLRTTFIEIEWEKLLEMLLRYNKLQLFSQSILENVLMIHVLPLNYPWIFWFEMCGNPD